jgi:hypothetical protein
MMGPTRWNLMAIVFVLRMSSVPSTDLSGAFQNFLIES